MSNSRWENIGDRWRAGSVSSIGSMPGLVAWLDASESGLMTVAGGLVSDVKNRATSVSFATASGAERPTLTAAAQNGRSGLTFDGAATLLHCNSLAATFSGTDKPFSVFSVFKRADLLASHAYFSCANSGVATTVCEFACNNTPKYRANKIDDAVASVTVSELGTSDTSTHQIASVCPGTTISTWVDGVSLGTDVSFDVGATTLDTATIGARVSTTTAVYFYGLIFETLIFSRAISTLERQTIEAYLKSKWGL